MGELAVRCAAVDVPLRKNRGGKRTRLNCFLRFSVQKQALRDLLALLAVFCLETRSKEVASESIAKLPDQSHEAKQGAPRAVCMER